MEIEQVAEEFVRLTSQGKLIQAEELVVDESQGRENELADWLRFIGIENEESKKHFISLHCFQVAKKIVNLKSIKEEIIQNLAVTHYNCAHTLLNMRKFKEAEKHYKKALDINPQCAEAHYDYAILLFNTHKFEEAKLHYKKALDINPEEYMNKIEQMITLLAETHRKSDRLICVLEELPTPSNEKGNFFLEVGVILCKFSQFHLALNSWNHALKYFIQNDNESGKSKCYTNLGNIYLNLGDFEKAIEYHEKSLEIDKKIGDKAGESACYTNLGAAYDNVGSFRKAIEYHKKSLEIVKEVGDRLGESKCYLNLGHSHYNLGEFRKAIEYYDKSLEIAREIGDKVGESACYTNLGAAYHNLGDFRKAIEYHKKSLEIDKEIGDEAGESICYTVLGAAHLDLGDFKKAIQYHKKSLEIAEEIGDKVGESACYTNLGTAYHSLGDFKKAIQHHEKALEIAEEIGDKAGEVKCHINLGAAYDSLGDFKKAIQYHEKALEIAEEIEDKAGESICHINLGAAYHSLGNFRKAIEYYSKSLEIARETGDRLGESACYANLGTGYHSLGDSRKAIEYYKKSLEIVREIGYRAGESKCYGNLGNAYLDLGEFRKAIEYYSKSLEIAEEIEYKAEKSKCYGNIGTAYHSLGDFKKSIEYHEKALEIAEEIGDKAGESKCYTNLGTAYHSLRNFKKAIEYQEKALEIAKKTGDINLEMFVNLSFGRIYYESKPVLAYDYCKRSLELSEMISGNLIEEQHKIRFSARASDSYHLMIPLCIELKKEKEAFEYTERCKSRAFLNVLAATEIKPWSELTDELKSLLDREEMYLVRLREIQLRHLRDTKSATEPGEIDKIHEKLVQIYDNMEKHDPEYVFIRRGKPLSLNGIQNMLFSQERALVLIEYFISKEKVFIFVVSSKETELHVEVVPLSAETFNNHLETYLRKVMYYPHLQDIGSTLHELSDYFIKPVSEYLTEGELIYFAPYGLLHYLPLHALKLDDEFLIKKHPVAYAPSASLIKFFQNKGSGTLQSCASFGVAFEEEAEDIAELFNAKARNGCLATRENVLKDFNKDIIHFACHGHFNFTDPLSSGIRLYDGILTAREIFGTRLSTELVTLAACQTGLNQRNPGDELIGLTRAFLYAGAPSVVVSLWKVADRSTHELMLEFYRYVKNGVDKVTALQKAQIKIMKKEEYSHPYYWAPFMLVGDWK